MNIEEQKELIKQVLKENLKVEALYIHLPANWGHGESTKIKVRLKFGDELISEDLG